MTMAVCETDCNIPHQQGGRTAIYVSGEAKTKLPQRVNRKQTADFLANNQQSSSHWMVPCLKLLLERVLSTGQEQKTAHIRRLSTLTAAGERDHHGRAR